MMYMNRSLFKESVKKVNTNDMSKLDELKINLERLNYIQSIKKYLSRDREKS